MLPKIQTILFTTDLSPGAPYVFRYALALAKEHKAKIIAVHSMEPLSGMAQVLVEQYVSRHTTEERHQRARDNVKAQLTERMEKLCAGECEHEAACETAVDSIHVVEGYPDQVILNLAKEYAADLIIMGTHGHSVVGGVIMGSTTRKVLHKAPQPVLVVRIPEDNTEEL